MMLQAACKILLIMPCSCGPHLPWQRYVGSCKANPAKGATHGSANQHACMHAHTHTHTHTHPYTHGTSSESCIRQALTDCQTWLLIQKTLKMAVRGAQATYKQVSLYDIDRGQHLLSPLSRAPRDCNLLAAEEAKRYSPAQALTTMR